MDSNRSPLWRLAACFFTYFIVILHQLFAYVAIKFGGHLDGCSRCKSYEQAAPEMYSMLDEKLENKLLKIHFKVL